MFCLVYVSAAAQIFVDEDLLALLRQSRRNNARLGVTGLLLHLGGNFMQALEGDEAKVRELHARIAADPRHGQVTTILRLPIAEQRFPDWSMGFANAAAVPEADRPAFSAFLAAGRSAPAPESEAIALRLLDRFRQTMR